MKRVLTYILSVEGRSNTVVAVSELTITAGELIRVVRPTVRVLSTAAHISLWFAWVPLTTWSRLK